MKLIKLEQFLKLFDTSPADDQTLSDFIKTAKVRAGKKTHTLIDYMQRNSIDQTVIEILFSNIQNRFKYLTGFYNMSLRVRDVNSTIHGVVKPMKKNQLDNNSGTIYKNLIRNLHMLDILRNTSSGLENIPTYMNVIIDLYTKNIIDYKILTPSAISYMVDGRLGSVFSSLYFRASILNPYLIYSLNMKHLNGTKIFTPTLGWSSYAFGFLECPDVSEYVGTDVIKNVCNKTQQLCSTYNIKHDIYCSPSEDLLSNKKFINKYREHFDVIFFSPPYYRLELYNGTLQSTNRYKSYSDWLNNYWRQTIKLCSIVANKDCRLCYILSDYGSENSKDQYNLIEDMNNISKEFFTLVKIQPMYNKNVRATNHRDTNEKIIMFTK